MNHLPLPLQQPQHQPVCCQPECVLHQQLHFLKQMLLLCLVEPKLAAPVALYRPAVSEEVNTRCVGFGLNVATCSRPHASKQPKQPKLPCLHCTGLQLGKDLGI